jgi:opacity protein-like surface antigen
MKAKIAAGVLGLLAFTGAHAQDGLYAGALISRLTYSEDGLSDLNPTAIGFKLGTQINPNFAVEARLGTGLSEDTIDGTDIDLELDNFIGVYGKGIFPLSESVSLYGLVGYTHGKLTASNSIGSVSDSDSDFSFGFGADFALSKSASIGVEWARLFEGDGYEVDGLSVGVSFKF